MVSSEVAKSVRASLRLNCESSGSFQGKVAHFREADFPVGVLREVPLSAVSFLPKKHDFSNRGFIWRLLSSNLPAHSVAA